MDISNFRATMTGDLARPNRFQVTLNLPDALQGLNSGNLFGNKLSFSCRAAQIPGSTVNRIPVPYQGRETYHAGDRIFAEWTITIINDEDFIIRRAFEHWLGNINSHVTNVRADALAGPSDYTADAYIDHLGKTEDTVIASYRMLELWPTDLSAIDMDWGQNDSPEEFAVTLSFDAWIPVSSTSGGSTLTTGNFPI